MRRLAILAATALLVFGIAARASADVQLTMQGGRVTLIAKDVTVRQILAEWARVGQTTIINGERIPGGPVTLELTDVPERQALEVLLRAISGYVAAPRAEPSGSISMFDRIMVMPTAVAPAPPVTAPPPTFSQPTFVQSPPAIPDDDDDDDRPNPAGQPQNRGPVFVFPSPQINNPQQAPPVNQGTPGGFVATPAQQAVPPPGAPAMLPPSAPYPGAPTTATPGGVAVPGMVAPVPTPQAGQPVFVVPAQPQQPQPPPPQQQQQQQQQQR
jgi:hypothetical protein